MSRPACSAPEAVTSPEPATDPSERISSPADTSWTVMPPPACRRTSELEPVAVVWAPRVMVPAATTSVSPPPRVKVVPDTVIGRIEAS